MDKIKELIKEKEMTLDNGYIDSIKKIIREIYKKKSLIEIILENLK